MLNHFWWQISCFWNKGNCLACGYELSEGQVSRRENEPSRTITVRICLSVYFSTTSACPFSLIFLKTWNICIWLFQVVTFFFVLFNVPCLKSFFCISFFLLHLPKVSPSCICPLPTLPVLLISFTHLCPIKKATNIQKWKWKNKKMVDHISFQHHLFYPSLSPTCAPQKKQNTTNMKKKKASNKYKKYR